RTDADALEPADLLHARRTDGGVERSADRDVHQAADRDRLGDRDRLRGRGADRGGLVGADRDRLVGADRDRLIGADRQRHRGADRLVEVRADRDGLVDPDLLGLVVADRLAEVVADAARFVDPGADRGAVDDRHVPVFLAVDVDLIGPGGIVEAQLVAAAAARRRVGPPAALGRAARDRERIRILAVVDAAGHQRTIRVALEELDQHLHADPRDELRAPAPARPALRAADPA